jgi:hypothetical protein
MHGEARSEIIRAHLEKLARDGRLTPEQVLTDARKKTSPIHDAFEWDDSKAAEQFRLSQARHLIARVEVEFVRDPHQPNRATFARRCSATRKRSRAPRC